MKTGLITSDTYQNHNTGEGHPEKIDRVTVIIENFKRLDNKNILWKKPSTFDKSFLINTHTPEYIEQISKSFPQNGFKFLDGDTVVSPGSKDATKDAVGSIIAAIDGVQNKEFKNAFCAVRPPGHHAERAKAMGFCIYNNVAVGANYLIEKYKYNKVAIIDFDVHHGNGTQDIFYNRSDVMFLSLHGDPNDAFPHFLGYENEKGLDDGYGYNFNFPMPPNTNYSNWGSAFDEAAKRIAKFKADALILSLGVDTFKDDPISFFKLDSIDFIDMGKRIKKIGLPTLFVMEGGYAIEEIGINTVNTLIGFEE